jgi:hypothetical protein
VTTIPSRESTLLLRKKSTTFGPSSGRPASYEITLATCLHEHAVALADIDEAYR